MKKLIVSFVLFVFVVNINAQEVKSHSDIPYPFDVKFKPSGWLIAPGFTYMLAARNADEEQSVAGVGNVKNTADVNGGFGAYLEIGRYNVKKGSRKIQYFDYTVAYKQFRGTEEFQSTITNAGVTNVLDAESSYNQSIVSASFNLNAVRKFNSQTFMVNALGINGDYIFGNGREQGNLNMLTKTREFQDDWYIQLHYRFGIGFKASKNFYVIPTVETPILTGYPFDNGLSSSKYFYTRHRPLIFGIRILWLQSNTHNCPPVYI